MNYFPPAAPHIGKEMRGQNVPPADLHAERVLCHCKVQAVKKPESWDSDAPASVSSFSWIVESSQMEGSISQAHVTARSWGRFRRSQFAEERFPEDPPLPPPLLQGRHVEVPR